MTWTIYVADDHKHKPRMPGSWISNMMTEVRARPHSDTYPEGFTILFDDPGFAMFIDYEDQRDGEPRIISYIKDKE